MNPNQQSHTYGAANANVYASTAPVPPPNTPIRDAVTFSEQSASEIHELISRLEDRLDTIVTPADQSKGASAGASPTPIMSHFKQRLDLHNQSLQEAANRLRALCARIEL